MVSTGMAQMIQRVTYLSVWSVTAPQTIRPIILTGVYIVAYSSSYKIIIKKTALISDFCELWRSFFRNINKIMGKIIIKWLDLLNFCHSCGRVRNEFFNRNTTDEQIKVG